MLVDYYSRWLGIAIMRKTTAEVLTPILTKIFSTHGLPLTITTDNGPQFISHHFRNYCKENGIEHRKITPIRPQANGEIERQNRSLLKRMRIAQAEKRNWKEFSENRVFGNQNV